MVKTIGFGVLAGALLSQPATALDAQKEGGLDGLIAQHAKSNGVPADLVHRVIKRESRYNPRAVGGGGAMGLMQIKHGTARALGYAGTPVGLLSAETNLTYGVRYLAGAYKVANGDPNRAVAFFARGYYYDAKRKGMLASLASGKAQPVQVEAEAAVPDVQQQTASIGFSMVAPVPSSRVCSIRSSRASALLEGEQHAVRAGGRRVDSLAAADAGRADRARCRFDVARGEDEARGAIGRHSIARHRWVALGENVGSEEHEGAPALARGDANRTVGLSLGPLIQQPSHMGRVPVRFSRHDLDPHDPGRAVRVPLQCGNPHRIAGQVLAGEDPHAGRRLLQRPLEDSEPRLGFAAVRQRNGAAEIDRPDPGNAVGEKFLELRRPRRSWSAPPFRSLRRTAQGARGSGRCAPSRSGLRSARCNRPRA